MGRFNVLSFISSNRKGSSKNSSASQSPSPDSSPTTTSTLTKRQSVLHDAPPSQEVPAPARRDFIQSAGQKLRRVSTRPASTLVQLQQQQQQPPLADVEAEPLPELEPIFGYLNNQAAKLYYEGYFFKLNDLDNNGRPCSDRQWTEYFAQLVGTVLSIWDPAALSAAGPGGDVPPTFINVADASLRMIETLPTRTPGSKPLQNVLSLSTAGKNRYLLHFNSFNALTQWTAAIRLTMYENTLLQESYTGALIAGKGRALPGMKNILEKNSFTHEDWARVRFGPGTPWRRCWCVITQPDEKAIQKSKKSEKRKSIYAAKAQSPKGNIKFYETKKTKKVKPIATISDAYSAFAIYPQSRPLVHQSTLVKVEGQITIHTEKESTAEGFVFVLPELHAAVSGFETMLRWLFPVFDAFSLYGRPTRLLADTVNTRSLMFAMPVNKRSRYLDILDVAGLIHTDGSKDWSEQEWRKQLKEATARRIAANNSRGSSIAGSKRAQRISLPPTQSATSLRFKDSPGQHQQRIAEGQQATDASYSGPSNGRQGGPGMQYHSKTQHARAASDLVGNSYANGHTSGSSPSTSLKKDSSESTELDGPPRPPPHRISQLDGGPDGYVQRDLSTSGSEASPAHKVNRQEIGEGFQSNPPPLSVSLPPAFSRDPKELPQIRRERTPDLGQTGNRISVGTLSQMVEVNKMRDMAAAQPSTNPRSQARGRDQNVGHPADYGLQRVATDAASSVYSPVTASSVYSPTSPDEHFRERNGDNFMSESAAAYFSSVPSNPYPQKRLSIDTQHTVPRKPVPQPADGSESPSAKTASSLGSLRDAIDVDALDRIVARDRTPSPPRPFVPREYREPLPDTESTFDGSSVASPDYASSHKSSVSKRSAKSVAKPRMGRKKVVGGGLEPEEVVIGDARYQHADSAVPEPNADIPLVDFGPTHTYNPTTRRPSTSDTLTLLGHNRNPSQTTLGLGNNNKRASFGKLSAGVDPETRRPISPGQEEKRRSMLWQPAMLDAGRHSPGPGISPEQFVEQRAAGNRISSPMGHYRSPSRPSPPSRPVSGDWTNFAHRQPMNKELPARPHSRGASVMLGQGDIPPRPQSRGASVMLGQNDSPARPHSRGTSVMLGNDAPARPHSRGASTMLGQNDVAQHLSAREQEHVARITGSSFFNMSAGDRNQKSAQNFNSGLVSAIDARERERQAMKAGVSGQMVQQAIMQRQYQSQPQPLPPIQMQPSAASQYQMQFQQPPQMYPSSASQYNAQFRTPSQMQPSPASQYQQSLYQAPVGGGGTSVYNNYPSYPQQPYQRNHSQEHFQYRQ